MITYRIFLFIFLFFAPLNASEFDTVPIAVKGRFIPFSTAVRLYFKELNIKSPSENFIFEAYAKNFSILKNEPLLWISNQEIKELLNLDSKAFYFSYQEVKHTLYDNQKSNRNIFSKLMIYEFLKAYQEQQKRNSSSLIEIKKIAPDLFLKFENNDIYLSDLPENNVSLKFFKKGELLLKNGKLSIQEILSQDKVFSEDLFQLFYKLHHLNSFQNYFKMIPSKEGRGKWITFEELSFQNENYTLYADEEFNKLKFLYLSLKDKVTEEKIVALGKALKDAYKQVAGTIYLEGQDKKAYYPTLMQLEAENFYVSYPINWISLFLFVFSTLFFFLAFKGNKFLKIALGILITAFIIQTFEIVLRIYILSRPPVSNMFETMLYVPWITVAISLILYKIYKHPIILLSSSLACFILLVILKASNLNQNLELVQPVLDSQYWLIIHVLMVVGSYGAFLLASLLSHFYLVGYIKNLKENEWMKSISRFTLQALYVGIAMLVPGTILGGIWALQSWGRFWDWDPKESWAFISISTYLIGIHCYRFNIISRLGLNVWSILGFLSISFTWYGVNYILGTGLHSYGFGSGGEKYYGLFFLLEILFLLLFVLRYLQIKLKSCNHTQTKF